MILDLRCDFCGGTLMANIEKVGQSYETYGRVYCNKCGVTGESVVMRAPENMLILAAYRKHEKRSNELERLYLEHQTNKGEK